MALKLDTSAFKIGGLSDLERQLHSEADTPFERESFWHKAGDIGKYILDLYFKPKSFERSGKIYEALGVRQFKKFMFNGDYMNALLKKFDHNYKLIRNKSYARDREVATRIFEGVHIGGCSIMVYCLIYSLADGDYKNAAINTALNTVVNIYPTMLQRYNRARIYNILDLAQKKTPLNHNSPNF